MGFTFILLLAYLALTGLAVITFRSGRKALGGGDGCAVLLQEGVEPLLQLHADAPSGA